MTHLDLDFKEKKCRFTVMILGFLFFLAMTGTIYGIYTKIRIEKNLKKEAQAVFKIPIKPVAFLKDSEKSALLVLVGEERKLLLNGASLDYKGAHMRVFFSDSQVIIKGTNFKRVIKW